MKQDGVPNPRTHSDSIDSGITLETYRLGWTFYHDTHAGAVVFVRSHARVLL